MATARSRAILFGFDGVLADTENIHVAAWERTFFAMGWDVAPEVAARAGQEDDQAFLEAIFSARSVETADLEGWIARKRRLAREMIASSPRIYAGVLPLVAALRAENYRLGVVTGTSRENVEAALDAAGLLPEFTQIITREDTPEPRPDPAGYALACRRLRVKPAMAVAFEDSEPGLQAALAAGLKAIAIGSRHRPGEWTQGAPYLANLRNTDAVLEQLRSLVA